MNNKKLKPNAKTVGAFIGRPHIEGNAPYKKEHQNKTECKHCRVATLGDPHFEENTPVSPKACSNSNAKHQTLTSNVAITLIALVITIIVMLILVGVTVSVAINGGLFSTAKKAVTKTEEAKDSELRFMAMANAATHDKLWTYTSKDGKTIPIPAGFAPTEIEGETSTEEGFVIIDAEGNEFVWIPCTKDDYQKATFDKDDKESWPANNEYKIKTWNDEIQTKIGEDSLKKLEDKKTELGLSDEGIGFYVARYEAGIPENAPFYPKGEEKQYIIYEEGKETTDTKNSIRNTNKYTPVSKKGYPAWNFISQTNAVEVSKTMYANNSTVDSYLIDSHAWNYICKNILGSEEKAKKDITNSTKWGNYYNNTTTKYENLEVLYAVHEYITDNWSKYADGDTSGNNSKYHKGLIPEGTAPKNSGNNRLELATGVSEDFKAYNIYDMAGNMWEWTTETSDNIAAFRGGSFHSNGLSSPVFHAHGNFTVGLCNVDIGFRVVLYVK